MRHTTDLATSAPSSARRARKNFRTPRTKTIRAFSFVLSAVMLLPGFALSAPAAAATTPQDKGAAQRPTRKGAPPADAADKSDVPNGEGGVYRPEQKQIRSFAPINVSQLAWEESLAPQAASLSEIKSIDAPRGRPESFENMGVAIPQSVKAEAGRAPLAPAPSVHGSSPGPAKTFKGEFLSSTSIPPDTMGAVGTTHVVNTTNDRMRIQTRDGAEVSRFTLSSFWAGVVLEGGAAVSAFDPKVLYDRFNSRWILISSANGQTLSSAALFAVSQTNDPTGLWNRYAVDADPTATATGGLWIDYPTIGHNKNWIVVHENTFGYGTITGYQRSDVYVLDKQAAYANTLSTISTFQGATSTCTAPFETKLGCGFTMAPTLVEDNTTEEVYLVEDWDSQFGQLRLSKLTGTAAAPVLTVGTQFPQSPNSWRFNASRIGPSSGGYVPQRQQSANLPSGTRVMANDSRMQNAVLRNGTLWCAHTVMLAATPTAAGVSVGGAANPDIRSGIQWWEIDPTLVDGGTGTPPIQRGRIDDPTANNCHNGSAGLSTVPTCDSTLEQVGQFYAFPNISVNAAEDVLIGYTMFSSLTYPNAAYSMRRAADTPNTLRDTVVYRPGQANYNIGSGSGTTRQNRWGDYSASMVDPVNDSDFWTVQEYAGTVRDFGIGLAGNWETWWAVVRPSAPQPSTAGTLIISEFRLRGPQGVRDEFVELYNPSTTTPVVVAVTDNSEGWSLVSSNDGTTVTRVFAVIPSGTVIPPRGHFLVANNPNAAPGVGVDLGCGANVACGPTLVYSLNAYPGLPTVRGADSDVGYSVDLADNGGIALFNSSNTTTGFVAGNRLDSVGFAGIAAGLFQEGTGIPNVSATTPTSQISFVRDLSSGDPKDTNNNAADFIFVSPTQETLTVTSRLGAPGPVNLDGPRRREAQFKGGVIDPCVGVNAAPNRSRDLTPVTNGAAGTLTIRRRYTNTSGVPVTRLRFRVVDVTSGTAPAGTADLRALSSTSNAVVISAACGGLTLNVQGTTLEEPPAQPGGGGLNSSLSAGSVALATPLAPGAGVNLQFVLGVQQTGTFRFFINLEALFDGVVTP